MVRPLLQGGRVSYMVRPVLKALMSPMAAISARCRQQADVWNGE